MVEGPRDPEHDATASYALEPEYAESLTKRLLATTGQTVDKEGFHNVRVALADGSYRALSFFVDAQPPVTSGAFVQDKDKLGGILTLTAKDSITPVALTRYQVQIDGETVTIELGPLVTVEIDMVRLIERYRPKQRRTPL